MLEESIIFEPTEFDYTNPLAEVVIVGITPGNSQLEGTREKLSPAEIKQKYAFAGRMRPNLIKMLDYIGVNHLLGIDSCCSLWEEDFRRVEMTSLLKEATFIVNDKTREKQMLKDVKLIERSEKLTKQLNEGFLKDCTQYNSVKLFVACGPGVYDFLNDLKDKNIITAPVVGIAHPSGANAGRISCYLGEKEPKDESYQWCRRKAEEAQRIIQEVIL